jgi:hypothetical protein
VGGVDVEITPEPTEEERQAILRALEQEQEEAAPPTPWRSLGLGSSTAAPEPGRDAGVVEP